MLPGKKLAIIDILGMLRRRAWLLVVPPVLGLLAALVYSSRLPDVYQAEVLVAVVPQRVPDAFVKSTVTLRTEERLDAITVQVTSRTLLEQMIEEFDMYPAERRRLPMEDVVQKMRADIKVTPERPRMGPRGPEPLHAFRVRFSYPDKDLVARVTQRVGSSFVDQNARDRGALAQATNEFLEVQLLEARKRLEVHDGRLEAFREQHGNELPTQFQSNMQGIQNTQLQIQALVESTARDRDRRLMLQRLVAEVESEVAQAPPVAPVASGTGTGSPASAASGTALAGTTATQRLASARQALAQLELRYKPEHPDVIRVKRLITELEPKAAAETAGGSVPPPAPVMSPEELARRQRIRDMRAEIESLDRQVQFKESEERRLRTIATEYQRRIEAVPSVEAEWTALTRDYETQKDAYEELLAKSEQSRVSLELERRQIGEQFRILDTARVPEKPSSPLRIQISGIGFGVGIAIGLGLALLLEIKDTSFRTEADVVTVLSLPVLALVPFVETAGERRTRRRRRLAVAGVAVLAGAAACYTFWSMRLWTYLA